MPIMFNIIPSQWDRGAVVSSVLNAAKKIGLFAIASLNQISQASIDKHNHIVPFLNDADITGNKIVDNAPMVMLPDSETIKDKVAKLKKANADRIVAVRLSATPKSAARVVELARLGIEVINLVFDDYGMETSSEKPRHMRDAIREVHGALVKEKVRDEVTLIVSGGIALPEHMAKAIICGADLITVDIPLVIAMDCRLCGECKRGEPCPVELENVEEKYATQRVINLMGSWHSQLLEMLGAMGIREARRLRGEVGRCMFFEDLERAAFGRIFGKRIAM
jgi:glutamate synthase domain-containing protein 2